MKLKQTSHPSIKIKVITTLTIVITLLGIGGYFLVKALQPSMDDTSLPSINYGQPSDEQTSNGTSIKENSLNSDMDGINVSGSDQSKGDASITITNKSQNGSNYHIGTLINANVATGTCTISLTKDGQATITQIVEVQAFTQYATCKGFDVETMNLAKGDWTVTVVYENDTLKGLASTTIMIQ